DAAHGVAAEDDVDGWRDGGGGRPRRDFQVDHLVLQPVAEAGNALGELAAGLELGVDEGFDGDVGGCGAGLGEDGRYMAWEGAEGVVITLEEMLAGVMVMGLNASKVY